MEKADGGQNRNCAPATMDGFRRGETAQMIGFQPYETFRLLIETGGIERANTLLVAACDAYSRRPKPLPAEQRQFEELVTRLFPSANATARERAARMLARSEYLSPLLEKLVLENIERGVEEYLMSARTVSDGLLDEIIGEKNIKHCAQIARRPDLGPKIVAKLFPINSRTIYRALAANPAINFRGPYLAAITRAAAMDHRVAASLAGRPDFDKALLAPAFFDLAEHSRLAVLKAFGDRTIPPTPLKRTFEQISVVTEEFTVALMKLFSKNRRPEVTRLLTQITGLDEVRCGQIAHDTSGAALFVILRAFGCRAHDGMKVLLHATSHEVDRSRALGEYARLFSYLSSESMVFLMSIWRRDVEPQALAAAEYQPAFTPVPARGRTVAEDRANGAAFRRSATDAGKRIAAAAAQARAS
jgi:Uncharacterised protein conserved in bacteria (DUF2336)